MNYWELAALVLSLLLVAVANFLETTSLMKKISRLEEQITALNRGLPLDLHKLQERLKELEYQQQPLRDR